jgi:3',5'-nucleoside bisphosphate phosphatase
MRIDLHVHSSCSDGAHPPEEVVRIAKTAGVDVVALTDHDTTSGLDEARRAGGENGVEVITGCEVSANYAGAPVHVLAYYFDPDHPRLAEELRLIRVSRLDRARLMVERLNELGVPITYERVREIAKGDSVARPHIAHAMVEAGVVPTTTDAFTKEWIGNDGRAYVEKRSLDPIEAVRLIGDAGGAAVVAHPIWTREAGMPETVIEELADAGLAGLEVDHPDHDVEARAHYRALAQRLGIVATGASDYHGNEHGGIIGSETTSLEALEDLRARAANPRVP